MRFGILVFPDVQQLDLTGKYEMFATAADSEVHLVWKDRAPLLASTKLPRRLPRRARSVAEEARTLTARASAVA